MKSLLTSYYTMRLMHEIKVNGRCKTMVAVKLKAKLKGLS